MQNLCEELGMGSSWTRYDMGHPPEMNGANTLRRNEMKKMKKLM